MNKKQTLKQALKTYYADKSLSAEQLGNLQQRLNQHAEHTQSKTETNKYNLLRSPVFKWTGSLAASVLLVLLGFVYLHTPGVISAAYADISKDAELGGGLHPPMQQWLNENSISEVPQQYDVEMSRFCRLDQYLTTHLRIAGVEQGKLHLFFHQGERPAYWLNRTGVLNKMNWKLVKVRDDLTLIVMYTEDMRETAVKQILGNILKDFYV